MIDRFDELLAAAGPVCVQSRSQARLRCHLLAQLVCLGQHTVTGLLTTTGQQQQDWSAAYRFYAAPRLDPQPLFTAIRRQIEAAGDPHQPLIVAVDDSLLRKRGRRIPGTAWRLDPLGAPFQVRFVWAQRVLQFAVVWPEGNEGAARTIPIDFTQAPTLPRPRRNADPAAWASYRQQCRQTNINCQAARRIEQLQHQRQAEGAGRPLWLIVDGRFTNRTFLKQLPPTVVTIGRIRGDARLAEALPAARPTSRGGRPRAYGRALPTPEQLRQDPLVPWQSVRAFAAGRQHEFRVKLWRPIRWRATGAQRALQLVVIAPLGYRLNRRSRVLYRKPAYLICTDPTVAVAQLLQAYLWRWGIEVNFRDEKTLLGVGQARVRNAHSVQTVPATAVAAYAMLLWAATRAGPPTSLPPPAWHRPRPDHHLSCATLINQLRQELWAPALRRGFDHFPVRHPLTQKPQKPQPDLASALFYAIAG